MGDQAGVEAAVEIVALVVSGVHAYAGRPADGPLPEPGPVTRDEVMVRAGLGLVGDRYFDHPAHRQASVTVLAAETLDALADELGLDRRLDPVHARRNIVLRGFPIDTLASRRGAVGEPGGRQPAEPAESAGWVGTGGWQPAELAELAGWVGTGGRQPAEPAESAGWVGTVFSLDCGTGPVRFRAHRPADPCAWMDAQLAPGAWKAMRGRGGVRCEPLDDGVLRLGPATLRVWPANASPEHTSTASRPGDTNIG